MELLGCGVPLLIEKPLALTSPQANELVALARQKGVALQVGHVERFNPALTAVAADVRDPKYIEATRTSGYTFRSTDIGVVLDLMIHDLDIVLSLAKSTVERRAGPGHLGARRPRGHGHGAAHVRQRLRGQLSASRVSFQQQRTMSIFTSRGSASINFATHEATVVKPSDDVLRREFRADQLSPTSARIGRNTCSTSCWCARSAMPQPVNAIQEEQRDFVAAIRTGQAAARRRRRRPRRGGRRRNDSASGSKSTPGTARRPAATDPSPCPRCRSSPARRSRRSSANSDAGRVDVLISVLSTLC